MLGLNFLVLSRWHVGLADYCPPGMCWSQRQVTVWCDIPVTCTAGTSQGLGFFLSFSLFFLCYFISLCHSGREEHEVFKVAVMVVEGGGRKTRQVAWCIHERGRDRLRDS